MCFCVFVAFLFLCGFCIFYPKSIIACEVSFWGHGMAELFDLDEVLAPMQMVAWLPPALLAAPPPPVAPVLALVDGAQQPGIKYRPGPQKHKRPTKRTLQQRERREQKSATDKAKQAEQIKETSKTDSKVMLATLDGVVTLKRSTNTFSSSSSQGHGCTPALIRPLCGWVWHLCILQPRRLQMQPFWLLELEVRFGYTSWT